MAEAEKEARVNTKIHTQPQLGGDGQSWDCPTPSSRIKLLPPHHAPEGNSTPGSSLSLTGGTPSLPPTQRPEGNSTQGPPSASRGAPQVAQHIALGEEGTAIGSVRRPGLGF